MSKSCKRTCNYAGCTMWGGYSGGKCRRHCSNRCSFPDCNRQITSKGMCSTHGSKPCNYAGCTNQVYHRKEGTCRRHSSSGQCSVIGCNDVIYIQRVCWKHSPPGQRKSCKQRKCCKSPGCTNQAQREKEGTCKRHSSSGQCSVTGCNHVVYAHRVCWKHSSLCSFQKCNNVIYARNLCRRHDKEKARLKKKLAKYCSPPAPMAALCYPITRTNTPPPLPLPAHPPPVVTTIAESLQTPLLPPQPSHGQDLPLMPNILHDWDGVSASLQQRQAQQDATNDNSPPSDDSHILVPLTQQAQESHTDNLSSIRHWGDQDASVSLIWEAKAIKVYVSVEGIRLLNDDTINDDGFRGDTDPRLIDDFSPLPNPENRSRNGKNKLSYFPHLLDVNCFYFFRDPGSDVVVCGVSSNLSERIYQHLKNKFIRNPECWELRYVRLSNAISPYKLEKFAFYIAFKEGHKHDSEGKPIHGEVVYNSSHSINRIIAVLCEVNMNSKFSIYYDEKLYYINSEDRGTYNISDDPKWEDFLENLAPKKHYFI